MKKQQRFELSKERRNFLIGEVKAYFLTERDEELGDLAAGFILDFFLEKLGPELYNQGISDAHQYMMEKVEDLLGIQK